MSDVFVLESARIAILLVFGLVLVHMWRKTRIDLFRSDMFAMRDEMFDYMWKHNLPYDSAIYNEGRRSMNAVIRFAHRINLATVLAAFVAARLFRLGGPSPPDAVFGIRDLSADPKTLAYFKSVEARALQRTALYVVLEDPLCFPLLPMLLALKIFFVVRHKTQSVLGRGVRAVLSFLEHSGDNRPISSLAWRNAD